MTTSPLTTACIEGRYDCGHITRSSSTAVKRAVFLHRAEVADLGYLGGRHEDAHTLAALALMRAGATCAEVLRFGTDAEVEATLADLDDLLPDLTPRQIEVLVLVSEGRSFPEIATRLQIATETVRSLSKAAMRATGTHSIVDAAVEAARRGDM